MDPKIKVLTSTNDPYKCFQLEKSLKRFGYDYHIIEHGWYGFLSKIHETYKYVKSLEGYSHFLYTDAWDTAALRSFGFEPKEEILLSAERACYPYPELATQYPDSESPWKYVNGGGWLCYIPLFLKMYEECPPTTEMNDQVYFTKMFLEKRDEYNIRLDYDCEVFQTIAFCEWDRDFSESDDVMYKPGCEVHYKCVFNKSRMTHPIFFHGNGHTPMDRVYGYLDSSETYNYIL